MGARAQSVFGFRVVVFLFIWGGGGGWWGCSTLIPGLRLRVLIGWSRSSTASYQRQPSAAKDFATLDS